MKGMTSGIENICFAFGTKNETVGTENESVETENHFFLKITCDGTNNQLWNYIDPWFFFSFISNSSKFISCVVLPAVLLKFKQLLYI